MLSNQMDLSIRIYSDLQEQFSQQVSENNFTANDEYSVGLPILSVVDIGLDSN